MTEHKQFTHFVIKNAHQGIVQAVFSTFQQIDHDGDVTMPGAFQDGIQVPISAYGHQSWAGALPVGKGTIRTTQKEAILDGRLFLETTAGRDTFTVLKELGDAAQWSYGFRVNPGGADFGDFNGTRVRFLRSLQVDEVSPVLVGAGIGTRTLAMKQAAEHSDLASQVKQTLARARHLCAPSDTSNAAAMAAALLLERDRFQGRRRTITRALTGQLVDYIEIPQREVACNVERAALRSLNLAAQLLGVPRPVIRWFVEDDGRPNGKRFQQEPDIYGLCLTRDGSIWLRADQPEHEAADTAAHELWHAVYPNDDNETSAITFGARIRALLDEETS